nr:FAD-dependent oxidoreductase [Halorussus salinisoli]
MSLETPTTNGEAVTELAETLRGALLRPDEEGYDEARTVWNATIDKHPALIVRCAGTADVVSAVAFAKKHDMPISVKGGGHNIAGRAVEDDALTIDLSPMNAVRADPDAKTARVEPGVVLNELDHETQAFGLATPVGYNSTTGIAGLTLGGGTAYPHRNAEFTRNRHTQWEDQEQDEECIAWTRDTYEAMTPHASGGVYANFVPEEVGDQRRPTARTTTGRSRSRTNGTWRTCSN